MGSVAIYGSYSPAVAGQDFPVGPAQWSAGATWPLRANKHVYANDLNEQLSAPVSFLSRKPMFKGSQQVNSQAIGPNTQTSVALDTEISDGWYTHSFLNDITKMAVPYSCDGIWLVQGCVPIASAPAGNFIYQTNLAKNNSIFANGQRLASTGLHVSPYVADLVTASTGDFFQLISFQTSTANVNTLNTTGPSGGVQYFDNSFPQITARWVAANNNLPAGVLNGVTLGIPNPGTWTSLQEVTTAQFNSDIRNSINFLANVPACRVSATGAPAGILTGTSAQITGLTSQIDNWHAFASNTWTCPVSGLYLVGGAVGFPSQASAYSTYTTLQATQSGVGHGYTGSNAYGVFPAGMALRTLRFTAGDTLTLQAFQNSGATLTPNLNGNTRMFTLWLSS